MKIIGMHGGMSWESTVSYYKAINEGVRNKTWDTQNIIFSPESE